MKFGPANKLLPTRNFFVLVFFATFTSNFIKTVKVLDGKNQTKNFILLRRIPIKLL